MKTFKEYLTESKKVYSFKVKVAGELPEKFQESLKARLDRCKIVTFETVTTTPIQESPMDFPELTNMEVTVFEVITEYPITGPELAKEITELGLSENRFRVRGSNEPSEQDQVLVQAESTGEALLSDSTYKESGKIKHKDYFGDEFNKAFLKDLEKIAKTRKKENSQGEYKLPKAKQDKEGAKSAMGSK
jgi:hypothetical protein